MTAAAEATGRDVTATHVQSQSHGVSANVVTSRRSVEREGCGRDSVTRIQVKRDGSGREDVSRGIVE